LWHFPSTYSKSSRTAPPLITHGNETLPTTLYKLTAVLPGLSPYFSVNSRDIGGDSGSDNQGIVIGLSLALGLTLVVIGALAVWKFRVRKNARRLMEDMGEGDL